jgi:hypothetical protein
MYQYYDEAGAPFSRRDAGQMSNVLHLEFNSKRGNKINKEKYFIMLFKRYQSNI